MTAAAGTHHQLLLQQLGVAAHPLALLPPPQPAATATHPLLALLPPSMAGPTAGVAPGALPLPPSGPAGALAGAAPAVRIEEDSATVAATVSASAGDATLINKKKHEAPRERSGTDTSARMEEAGGEGEKPPKKRKKKHQREQK